jgi:hypothetical protein
MKKSLWISFFIFLYSAIGLIGCGIENEKWIIWPFLVIKIIITFIWNLMYHEMFRYTYELFNPRGDYSENLLVGIIGVVGIITFLFFLIYFLYAGIQLNIKSNKKS